MLRKVRDKLSYLSLEFGLFAVCLVVLFYVVPVKLRKYVLLLGSLFFYGSYDLGYFLFLLCVAAQHSLLPKCSIKNLKNPF